MRWLILFCTVYGVAELLWKLLLFLVRVTTAARCRMAIQRHRVNRDAGELVAFGREEEN